MKKTLFVIGVLAAATFSTAASAQESRVPSGVPSLDHVFVIMMENHGYGQIVGNPAAPFANSYAKSSNSATNYFAIGHPSSTNYLEVVGGSNFGDRSDNGPDWHNASCAPNIVSGFTTTDFPATPDVCPIAGVGIDAATPPIDLTNECPDPSTTDPCPPGLIDIDGSGLAAAPTVGKMIGDQLVEHGLRWKSYQESLPPTGADNVDYSDGYFTDATLPPPASLGGASALLKLYAAKHNPFVYFKSVQEGHDPHNSLANVVGFEGDHGLWDDLASGQLPNFSIIVPNQCNDQHGRGNGGTQCAFDPVDDGSQAGLNPALIYVGDLTLKTIVAAIHRSPVWQHGRNAIVVWWDENDYSFVPNLNQVLLIVDTNYGPHGLSSNKYYTHFSLLRTLEGGFGLPCLNHACDANSKVMSDLFGGDKDNKW